MLKVIIFDMDGVLVNSTKYIWESFNILLKDSGIQFSNKEIKKYLGLSLKDKLRLWKRDYGINEFNLEDFSRKAGEIELNLMKKDLKLNENINSLIKEAKSKGIKLAVATSSLRWRAEKILDLLKIKEKFDIIITAEDVINHKPSPDIFLKVANKLNENPKNCLVFEDAKNGIEAAKKGNMKVVAIKTEYYSEEDLKNADLIINDFSEVNIQKLKILF